jgi:hypothetical protein
MPVDLERKKTKMRAWVARQPKEYRDARNAYGREYRRRNAERLSIKDRDRSRRATELRYSAQGLTPPPPRRPRTNDPEIRRLRQRERSKKHRLRLRAEGRSIWAERYANDPAFRMTEILRAGLRNALRKAKANLPVGTHRTPYVLKMLGMPLDEFLIYIESKFQTGMTWQNHGQWHLDHIRPVASFDMLNEASHEACFHYSNFQPLWAADNLAKRSRDGYWRRTAFAREGA